MNLNTCQICGRAIKANTGLIAHHGYKRPGDGWQTASCMGARHRPYEVACDALPPAIESCSRYIAQQEAGLQTLMTEPPATLTYDRRDGWGKILKTYTYERPADFDANGKIDATFRFSYGYQFVSIQRGFEHRIKDSQESLTYLKDRLDRWVAPATAG